MLNNPDPIRFNFFDFNFTPLKGGHVQDSKSILKECIKKINEELANQNKAIVIDRNEGKQNSEARTLFVSSAAYLHNEKKYKCKIALFRENKIPTFVNRKTFTLTPMTKLEDNAIAETTNFYIDMQGHTPVVCCEFHNEGPRISDIEYYFRFISSHKMLGISKACKAAIHMKLPVNEVLDSIKDVLKFRIKVRPNKLAFLFQEVQNSFISNMNALAGTVNPTSIKVEASFRETISTTSVRKNNKAIKFAKRILEAVKNDNKVVDDFEDFYLEFENDKGSEVTFSLLKGKHEILVECPYETPGNLNTKILFDKATIKFDQYLNSRNKIVRI